MSIKKRKTFLGRNYSGKYKQWIYRGDAERRTSMLVLVLGLPRTGTASMAMALETLDYNEVYHMASCIQNPPDCAMWTEAINAKFNKLGKAYEREDWDKLLGHCQAVTDFPAAVFAKELIEAYPDAKVILNYRDPDAWYESVERSIIAALRSRMPIHLNLSDPHGLKRWLKMCEIMWNGFFGVDVKTATPEQHKERFRAHYCDVRAMVPPGRLLEFDLADGWEPLCKFLGRPVPRTPFPHVNESADFERVMKSMFDESSFTFWFVAVATLIATILLTVLWKTMKSTACEVYFGKA